MNSFKKCSICNKIKEISLFYPRKGPKDGLSSLCRECNNRKKRLWKKSNPQKVINSNNKYIVKNHDKVLESKRKWRRSNKELQKRLVSDWEMRNPERVKEKFKRYRLRHCEVLRERAAAALVERLKRVPVWLSEEQKKEMINFYKSCPESYQVDHIVPLRGKNVSGLHVPWNLQYLTATENLKKGNRWPYHVN